MKLIQLELENFRQFERAVIDFGEGMTAIVGANGAGKTTILEAIAFALFAKQRDTQETLRWHWAQKGRYSVVLRFQLGGKVFEVMRGETKAHVKQILNDGEQVWASSKEQAERCCINLLGMSYLRFKNSFCAEQKDLKFLNFERRTDVQQEIIRMLGYDRLKDAEDRAKEYAKVARNTAIGIRGSLGDKAELTRRLKESQDRLAESERLVEKTRTEIEVMQANLPSATISRDAADNFKKFAREIAAILSRKEALLEAVKVAENQVSASGSERDRLIEIEPSENAYRALEAELKVWETRREIHLRREILTKDESRLLQEVSELEARKSGLHAPDIAELDRQKRAFQDELDRALVAAQQAQATWEATRRDAEKVVGAAKGKVSEIERQVKRSEEMLAKGICPECGQPLSTIVSDGVNARREALRIANEELDRANTTVESVQQHPKEVVQALKQADIAKQKYEDALLALQRASLIDQQIQAITQDLRNRADLLARVRADLSALPSDYDAETHRSAIKQLEGLRPSHEDYLRLQDAPKRLEMAQGQLSKARTDLEQAVATYKDLKAKQSQLGFATEAEADNAIARLQALEGNLQTLTERLRGESNVSQNLETEKKRTEELLEKLALDQVRLTEQEEADALYEQVSKQMRILRDQISTQIVPDLVGRASENLALLTNGRYLKLDLDQKTFAASLVDGETRKRVISGGEEDVVALCLRLALSELIQERQGHPMSLLILDEVFGSLDPERRQSVLDRLVALRPRFQQILVISHIEEINQVADRCLYVRHDTATHASYVSDVPPQSVLSLDF